MFSHVLELWCAENLITAYCSAAQRLLCHTSQQALASFAAPPRGCYVRRNTHIWALPSATQRHVGEVEAICFHFKTLQDPKHTPPEACGRGGSNLLPLQDTSHFCVHPWLKSRIRTKVDTKGHCKKPSLFDFLANASYFTRVFADLLGWGSVGGGRGR